MTGDANDRSQDNELIQGGDISGLDADGIEWKPEKHHAETARGLAFLLVWVLVVSFILHYLAIVVLSWMEKASAVDTLSSLFGVWLPVISGFVGGAVTYYFTKERQQ